MFHVEQLGKSEWEGDIHPLPFTSLYLYLYPLVTIPYKRVSYYTVLTTVCSVLVYSAYRPSRGIG